MNCRRHGCGHPRESHDECGRCHVTIMTGWNEAERRFTGQRDCDCLYYQGPVPSGKATPDDCPHEVQIDGDNPHRCVHCKKIVVKK